MFYKGRRCVSDRCEAEKSGGIEGSALRCLQERGQKGKSQERMKPYVSFLSMDVFSLIVGCLGEFRIFYHLGG